MKKKILIFVLLVLISTTVLFALDARNNRIKNVANPINAQDAATKQYVLDTAAAEGHNILSSAHGDATPAAVSRGSLIVGNSDPNWDELVLGVAGYIFRSDGTDARWMATTNITSLGTIGTGVWQGTDVGTAFGGTGASTLNDLITLTTHTVGNYAAGDAEAGSATSGDSATAFFDAGTIEHEWGGLEADISGYTAGLYGMAGGATLDIDTLAELIAAIGDVTTFVVEGTACSDLEGTGLSISAGILNWAAASTDLSDSADLLYEAELDDFSELQAQISDKTLVNEEDAVTWDALGTFNLGIISSATVQAEQLTSTDDITMQGHLLTLGDDSATDIVISFKGSAYDVNIIFDESANEFDFEDANLATTGDLAVGSLVAQGTVGIGESMTLSAGNITDVTGTIDFDDEDLFTKGDITAHTFNGILEITGNPEQYWFKLDGMGQYLIVGGVQYSNFNLQGLSTGFTLTGGYPTPKTLTVDETVSLSSKAPLASPTFTGTVTIPTPFTIGAVSMTATGTQLNYLNAATGTTGTTSTNLVFSTSPTFITPTLDAALATSIQIGADILDTNEWAFLDGIAGYVYRAGGTDVPLADGGTGASTAAAALANLSGQADAVFYWNSQNLTGVNDLTLAGINPDGANDAVFFEDVTTGLSPILKIYGYKVGTGLKYATIGINTLGNLIFGGDMSNVQFSRDLKLSDNRALILGNGYDAILVYDETNNDAFEVGIPPTYRAWFMDVIDVETATDITGLGSVHNNINVGVLDADLDSYIQIGFSADDTAMIYSNRTINFNNSISVDQASASGAKPVLRLDQGDVDDSFVDFIGTSAADGTRSISSDTTEDSAKFGAIRVEINSVTKWIRIYDDES